MTGSGSRPSARATNVRARANSARFHAPRAAAPTAAGHSGWSGPASASAPLRPRRGLVADAQVRELAHRRRQPQHQVGVAVGEGPLERGAQVVVVGEGPFHPGLFGGAPQREGGFLGQLGVVPGVRPGHRVEIDPRRPRP